MEAVIEQTGLKKYPAYKDSGVEWLGEIPAHWEVSRLGKLLAPTSVKNRPDLPLLSITREKGVILRDMDDEEENHNFIPDDLSGYKILNTGEFGMNKMKAWQGSYGVSPYTGIVSPAYYTFILSADAIPEFFHLAVRSKLYVSFFGAASDGVRIGQWDLSKDRMKQIPFLLPPIEEQTAIANFLNRKIAQIDKAIAQKERLIELLKERRQILIHKAVTRGLDPNVRMKDSGVEWIGEIPEHWEMVPNKQIFRIKKNLVGKNSKDYELLSLTLKGIIKRDMENPEGKFPAEFDTYQEVAKGDFIFCLFDVEETPRTVGLSRDYGMITGAYTVMEVVSNFDSDYLYNFYLNLDHNKRLKFMYKGLRNTIPKEAFLAFKTFAPPLAEQKNISAFIEDNCLKIHNAIEKKAQEIERLREYKTTVINAAVTGKIRVL